MNTHSDGPNRNAVTTAQSGAALVASISDTLIDCMTSFGIHGDAAKEAADYILSPHSGLSVSVADVEPEPHEYGDRCDCALCVRVRIEDMS